MEIDYVAIGKRIQKFRRKLKMSQEQLAEQINVSVPHMSNIENGKTKFSIQVLIKLAGALDTTPDRLLLDQLKDSNQAHDRIEEEICHELSDCTLEHKVLIEEMVRNTKKLLKKYDSRR